MPEIMVTPVLDIGALCTQAKLVKTHRQAVEAARQGNIYIEIMPDDAERAFWVRLDFVKNGVVVIPSRTRLRLVDSEGEIHIATVVPRPGRLVEDLVTNED